MKQYEEMIRAYLGEAPGLGEMDDLKVSRLADFVDLLSTYDQANVIGTREPFEILYEHIIDSLSCLRISFYERADLLVDVGSGAGLPGIPLAVASPDKRFTLVDSVGKKTKFQELALAKLGIENVSAVNRRIEEIGRDETHRGRYDVAVSRALAPLEVVLEYCLPLVKVGGVVIGMKGRLDEEEVRSGNIAARKLGGIVKEIHKGRRVSPQAEKERHLVVVEKLTETPARYPRDVGVPAKKPLSKEKG